LGRGQGTGIGETQGTRRPVIPVVLHRAARLELDEAALWYEERRVDLGIEFIAEIDRCLEVIAEYPELACGCRPRRHPAHNGQALSLPVQRVQVEPPWGLQLATCDFLPALDPVRVVWFDSPAFTR